MEPTAGHQRALCVICLKPERSPAEECSGATQMSTFQDERQPLQYFLKLLKIKDWKDITIGEASFCEDCFHRNYEAFKIMVQIAELKEKVHIIMRSIEQDFKASFSRPVDQSITTDIPNNGLRHRIATKLRLVPNSNHASADTACTSSPRSFECDENWSDSSSGTVESHAGTFNSSADRNRALRLAFGIKECSVVLSPLPSNLLRDHSVRRKSSAGGFKCIFADCPSKGFRSEQDRANHMRRFHSTLMPTSKQDAGDQKRPFSCIFADCDRKDFKSQNEVDAHVIAEHVGTRYQGDMSKFLSVGSTDDLVQIGCNTLPKDVPKQDTATQGFQCIFADCDCSHGGHFPNLESRNSHLRQAHGMTFEDDPSSISVKSNKKRLRVQDTQKKELKNNGFKCIFADCSESQSFDTEEARDSHVKDDHGIEESVVKDYKNDNAVVSPSPKSIPKPPPSSFYQCTVQGCKNRRCYTSKDLYEIHMKKAHEGITHPFVCDECGRKFRTNKELQNHVKTSHLGQFPFICQYCAKGFLCLAALNIHLPKHTNERNHKCDQCPEAFKTQAGLLYHTRSVHTGERPFRCDRCGKGFFTSPKLTNHIKCVHNREERPCICHICGKGFPIRNYLYMHLRSHRDDNKSVKVSSAKKPAKASAVTDLHSSHHRCSIQSVNSAICSTVDDNRPQENPSCSSLAMQTAGPPPVLLPVQQHTTLISSTHPEVPEQQHLRGSQNPCLSLPGVPSYFTAYYANLLQDTASFHQQGHHN